MWDWMKDLDSGDKCGLVVVFVIAFVITFAVVAINIFTIIRLLIIT